MDGRTNFIHLHRATGVNPQLLKGVAIGMGVEILRVGSADSITIEDARRIKQRHEEYAERVRQACQPLAI